MELPSLAWESRQWVFCDQISSSRVRSHRPRVDSSSEPELTRIRRYRSCHYGWYHWYLWTGRQCPDIRRVKAKATPLHQLHPAGRWSICRSVRSSCRLCNWYRRRCRRPRNRPAAEIVRWNDLDSYFRRSLGYVVITFILQSTFLVLTTI
jgi:hypothetical protein